MISVCEMIPNANQPVWNRVAFALLLYHMMNQRTAKHRISSRDEMDPNTNM